MRQYHRLILLLFCFFSCSQGNKNLIISKFIDNHKYWVNLDYLSCLDNQLPEKCIPEEPHLLVFDSLKGVEVYEYMESYYADITKDESSKYFIKMKNSFNELRFDFKKNLLMIGQTSYTSNNRWNEYNKYEIVNKLNGVLFYEKYEKDSIISRYFNKDSIFISYNNYFRSNIISNSSDCSMFNIIEFSKDSVKIFKFLNACEPKVVNFLIKKELFYKRRR